MNQRLLLLSVLLAAVLVAGCDVSLPNEYQIEDLRILEIRADPPEISIFRDAPVDASAEDLGRQAPNLRSVTFTALLAHPDLDAELETGWVRCKTEPAMPGAPSSGLRRVPCAGERRIPLGRGELEVSPIGLLLEDALALEGDVGQVISGLVEDPRDLLGGFYAYFNVEAAVRQAAVPVDTLRLEGTKRLVLFDPAVVALALREARRLGPGGLPEIQGFPTPPLCTQVTDQVFGEVLEHLRTRTPNRAPVYERLEVLLPGATATTSWSPGDEPIVLAPGEELRLQGFGAEGDLETYRVIDDHCRLIERTETLAFSWFTNLGSFSVHITSQSARGEREARATTTYIAPVQLDRPEERVRIWSVVRDGRGGSDNRVIELRVRR